MSVVILGSTRSQSDNHYINIRHVYGGSASIWTFRALKTFLAVAQERSFSRAAAKVHRTQPAVSQAIRRLEADLGEQLFDRSSKSGTLTDAGKVLQNSRAAARPDGGGNRISHARAALTCAEVAC